MNHECPPAHRPSCPCEGCRGTRLRTPRDVSNPPGRSALRYRIGRYADFLSTMTSRLGVVEVPDPLDPNAPRTRPLEALTARSPSDPTIALLDACAVVAESLTFYQERIANEAYLPTAEEGRSLAELARLVGYVPRPGVAASVPLAFELEVGSKPLTITAGTRSQSVPADSETAQMFETLADIPARREWNNLKPLATRQQLLSPPPAPAPGEAASPTPEVQVFFFKGTATGLRPNDPLLLLIDGADSQLWRARTVDADLDADRTTVVADPWQAESSPESLARRAAIDAAVESFKASRDLGFVRNLDGPGLDAALAALSAGPNAATLGPARAAVAAAQAVVDSGPVDALGLALSAVFSEPPSRDQRGVIQAAVRAYNDVNGGRSAAIAVDLANRVDAATTALAKASTPSAVADRPADVVAALRVATGLGPGGLVDPLARDVGDLQGSPAFAARFNPLLAALRALLPLADTGATGSAIADPARAALSAYIKGDPISRAVDAALASYDPAAPPAPAAPAAPAPAPSDDDAAFFQRVDDLRKALTAIAARINRTGTALDLLIGSLDSGTVNAVSDELIELLRAQAAFLRQDSALTDRLFAYLKLIALDAPHWVATTGPTNPTLIQDLRGALGVANDEELQDRLTAATHTLGVSNLLPTLRREARLFEGGAYPRLKPSFDRLLAKLQSISEVIRLNSDAVNRANDDARLIRGLPAFQQSDPALEALIPLLSDPDDDSFATKTAALWKDQSLRDASGSVPGATQAGLVESFGAGSERAIAVLSALSPDRAAALRTALANADIRKPLTFSVEAPRAFAAPFGSIAPPRASSKTTGGVTETLYEDWPLFDRTLTFSIPNPTAIGALDAFQAVGRDADSKSPSIRCPVEAAANPTPKDVPPFKVSASKNTPGTLVLTLASATDATVEPLVVRVVATDANGAPLAIQVADQDPFTLRPGDSGARASKDWEISLVYRARAAGEPASLAVTASLRIAASADAQVMALDAVYDKILPGSHITIERVSPDPGTADTFQFPQVRSASTVSINRFGITGKVTELKLSEAWLAPSEQMLSDIRRMVVLAQGEALDLAEEPYDADIRRDKIVLDDLLDGFEPGRLVLIEGERTDIPGTSGVRGAELVRVLSASQVTGTPPLPTDPDRPPSSDPEDTSASLSRPRTMLTLTAPLRYSYRRDRTNLYANVAPGGHGETRPEETLGGGDPTRPGQRFPLKQQPLTYVPSADAPGGAEPQVTVRLDGVAWQRAEDFASLGPDDRVYVLRPDGDGGVAVTFGDGTNGARPPAGSANIKAVYRVGLGPEGNVAAGQISQLVTRPQGVTGVTNPMPATGGAGPEPPDRIRRNAPAGLLALDRLVSAGDVADFARAFAGVAKAFAARVPMGLSHGVRLTIAAQDDAPLDPSSALVTSLAGALSRFGDPSLPIAVEPRKLKLILIEAGLSVDASRRFADVADAARARMLDLLGFDNRELGQDVSVGAIIAALQSVPGVTGVVVDAVGLVSEFDGFGRPLSPADLQAKTVDIQAVYSANRPAILPVAPVIRPGRPIDPGELPAELAYLSSAVPETLVLKELRP